MPLSLLIGLSDMEELEEDGPPAPVLALVLHGGMDAPLGAMGGLIYLQHTGNVFLDRDPCRMVWRLTHALTQECLELIEFPYDSEPMIIVDADGMACVAADDVDPLLVRRALTKHVWVSPIGSDVLQPPCENGTEIVGTLVDLKKRVAHCTVTVMVGEARSPVPVDSACFVVARDGCHVFFSIQGLHKAAKFTVSIHKPSVWVNNRLGAWSEMLFQKLGLETHNIM